MNMLTEKFPETFSALRDLQVSFREDDPDQNTLFPQNCFTPRVRNFSLLNKEPVPEQCELMEMQDYCNLFTMVAVKGKKKRESQLVHPRNLVPATLSDLIHLLKRNSFTDEQLSVGIVALETWCRQVEPFHIGFAGWVKRVPGIKLKDRLELIFPQFNQYMREYILLVPR
jgi:hypothetical protein